MRTCKFVAVLKDYKHNHNLHEGHAVSDEVILEAAIGINPLDRVLRTRELLIAFLELYSIDLVSSRWPTRCVAIIHERDGLPRSRYRRKG